MRSSRILRSSKTAISIRIDYVDYRNISVDYDITVPADTVVRSHTGSGDQMIEGTRGNADVQTGSGDVKLANLNGEIHCRPDQATFEDARSPAQ